jgi:thiosulfate/3-mercaptopyruvate sulfurtransferase
MIETLYGTGQLVTFPEAKTFFLALLVGLAFGFALERAGFGSSRRLAGIFYFRDMTVLKVMFTALITGMLALSILVGMGWLDLQTQINLLPTLYGAQAVGGLIFGVGFVLSSWCPGTAAVGVGSGRLDALTFLAGVVLGSVAYNETYGLIGGLRRWGAFDQPLAAFGMSTATFGFLFTLAAVGAFYFAEWVERKTVGGGKYLGSSFLRAFSLALVIFAAALFIFPSGGAVGSAGPSLAAGARASSAGTSAQALLESIEAEEDHFEPEQLADRLMQGDNDLVVVDVRTPAEYETFHIRGAVNVPLSGLLDYLAPFKNTGTIVLYSNGMTHPAQARDILTRAGFDNVFMLTGGLTGFVEWCLKPVSLRDGPLPAEDAQRVRAWRAFFLEQPS